MRFVKLSWMVQSAAAGLCVLAMAADPAPSTQPSTAPTTQAATTQPTNILLTSWEGSLGGWHIFVDDAPGSEPEAIGTSFSKTGATDGKQALGVQIKGGFRKSLRVDDVTYAKQIKGHKLSLDVTAPPDAAVGSFLQVTVAAVGSGLPWAMTPVKPVEQDGKPHTLIFHTS